MDIVDENVGFTGPLQELPGCNLLWTGTGPKPTCNPEPPTPGFVSPKTPLPSGWHELGCVAEGPKGRAFTSTSTTNDAMTKAVCANFCSAAGFPYAGVEFGRECYCGKSFSNGAVNNTVAWSDCSSTCSGNSMLFSLSPKRSQLTFSIPGNENCGGPDRLTLLYNPSIN